MSNEKDDAGRDVKMEAPDRERVAPAQEPRAAEGPRSLQNWQNLAKVRQSLAGDNKSREAYEKDPVGYMQRFGIDVGNMVAPGQSGVPMAHLQHLDSANGEGPDVQLAFCKVWGIVLAVAGVVANAGANANVVANANAAADINAAANLNVNVNGIGPASEG
jgi:hypothetical protein